MIVGSQLVTAILNRARDPQGIATSRATCLSLASTCQQVVNGILGDVIASQSLQLQPRTLIYPLSTFVASAITVVGVRDSSGRDLTHLDDGADGLAWVSTRWIQDVSDSPRCWSMIGHDLLVIYPAVRLGSSQSVTVFYSQLTPALLNEMNDSTVVPGETDYAIEQLTEALINLKSRDYEACKASIEKYATTIKQINAESR